MEKKKFILSVVMLLLLVVVTIGVTYAAFTFSKEGTIENTIESSTVMLTYTEGKTGIILEDALPISDETGKLLTGTNNVFEFTVTATLGKSSLIGYEVTAVKIPITDMTPLEDNEVKLYLERAIDPDTTYESIMEPTNFIPRETETKIGSPVGSMILDQGNFTMEGTTIHNYRLRMWVDENTEIGDTPKKYGIRINVYAKQDVAVEVEDNRNPNITNIYVYNQETGSSTFCVTGEESTCVELKTAPETYETGTIIKYKVNDAEEKYFHVMFDEGDTLTLQHRENTVPSGAWYLDENYVGDNTKGPTTILPVLENATFTWNNVLDQTYTLGTTVFKDNEYTGCDVDSTNQKITCVTNTYTLPERISKARMITIQETLILGCTMTQKSCPIWMYNYLSESTSNGGTVNKKNNYGYWTSSAIPSIQYRWLGSWFLDVSGNMGYGSTALQDYGARAVVVIPKTK